MKAYTLGITKETFVAEMKQHKALDHFLKGTYTKGDRGCAVGCALKSINKLKGVSEYCNNHKAFETYLGVPEWLAKLEDTLFEGLYLERSKVWPVEFSEAINTGAYLEAVRVPFIIFILKENIKTLKKQLKTVDDVELKRVIDNVIAVTKQMIAAHKSGNIEATKSAARSAELAARSAESAAWLVWSAAGAAARAAVWSAAHSTKSAARSAELAARSAESAARSACSVAYEKYANYLLKLLKEYK